MAYESTVEVLLAERAIMRCLHHYARSVDRQNYDEVAACYHADARDTRAETDRSVHEVVESIKANAAGQGRKQHFITNAFIEVRDDQAVAESYFLCYLEDGSQGGAMRANILAGRYVDRFERRDDEWLIVHRTTLLDWSRALGHVRDWPGIGNLTPGSGWATDVADLAFRDLRAF